MFVVWFCTLTLGLLSQQSLSTHFATLFDLVHQHDLALLPFPPGFPSNPSMPVVSVVGSSVSIQLSTRYPGTNARGQFRFSLIFSAASTAKRQSLQPTEVRVDPTGLDSSVTTTHTLTDVAAGSYSVSVMAENENGMSQEMTTTSNVTRCGSNI